MTVITRNNPIGGVTLAQTPAPPLAVHVAQEASGKISTDKIHIQPTRSGIPATSSRVQIAFHQAQDDFGTAVAAGQSTPPARTRYYGEDFAAMYLTGRTSADYVASIQSPTVTNIAEMTILDRYKPALEDQLKEWLPFLKRSDMGTGSGKILDVNLAFQFKSQELATDAAQEKQSVAFFKPTIGLKVSEVSAAGIMIKPGVDVFTYKGEKNSTVVVAAGAAVNIKGQVYPDAELIALHGLVNSDQPDQSNNYMEGRSHFDTQNDELQMRVGVRHEVGQDEALGVYSRYTQTFNAQHLTDYGLGVYYQKRF